MNEIRFGLKVYLIGPPDSDDAGQPLYVAFLYAFRINLRSVLFAHADAADWWLNDRVSRRNNSVNLCKAR